MSESAARVRKWGNSIGVTIPKEIADKEKIKPNDDVIFSVRKVKPIAELFGTVKFKKPTQKIIDELKKGWE